MGTFLERIYITLLPKGIIIKPSSVISGQPRVRDTVAKRAAARAGGGSSPSVHKSSPRSNAPPSSAPTAFSFMQNQSSPLKPIPQNVRNVVLDSSSEEEAEDKYPVEEVLEDDGEGDNYQLSNAGSMPRRGGPRTLLSGQATRSGDQPLRIDVQSPVKRRVLEPNYSDEDDLPLLPIKTKKLPVNTENIPIMADAQSEDDDDVFSPRKTTNRLKRTIVLDGSDEDMAQQALSSPTKRRRLIRRGGTSSPVKEDRVEDEPTPRPPPSSAARRKPRTEKEKARELLRRKRAGEVINEEEEDDESEEEAVKPLYDYDSDQPVLREFWDDEEGVFEIPELAVKEKSPEKTSPKKKKRKTIESGSGSDSDVNIDVNNSGDEDSEGDWLVEDGHIGVPDDARAQIPLKFTSHSHKVLKEHFRDVIEWFVLNRIIPGFVEKQDDIYQIGFQKLDDEVRGLGESKFSSSAWKPDFIMTLRARPEFTSWEVGAVENNSGTENCTACGRSRHPVKYVFISVSDDALSVCYAID